MKKKSSKAGDTNGVKQQQQIRMDEGLVARIHKYRERMKESTGLEVSFASAVRSLIEKGLEAQ